MKRPPSARVPTTPNKPKLRKKYNSCQCENATWRSYREVAGLPVDGNYHKLIINYWLQIIKSNYLLEASQRIKNLKVELIRYYGSNLLILGKYFISQYIERLRNLGNIKFISRFVSWLIKLIDKILIRIQPSLEWIIFILNNHRLRKFDSLT